MRHPWDADHELGLGDVEALVAEHVADGLGGPVAYLGEGWDYRAYTAGDDVLRFAKRADVAPQLAVEARILELVGPLVPVAVPALRAWPAEPRAPHGFTSHRRLPGRPLLGVPFGPAEATAVAAELGAVAAALHAIPPERARACGAQAHDYSSPAAAARRSAARLRAVSGHLSRAAASASERLLAAPPVAAAGDAVLIHGDLWPEHVLVDEASLGVTGIIDWGDVQVGDPADDFAAAWFLAGDEGLDACLGAASVPGSRALVERSRFWGVHHAIGSAWYGLEQRNEAAVRLALGVLERLA